MSLKRKVDLLSLKEFVEEKLSESSMTFNSNAFDINKMAQGNLIADYMKNCPLGDENDKLFMKQLIQKHLTACAASGSENFPAFYGINAGNIDQVLDWANPSGIDPYLKFLAVLLYYKNPRRKAGCGLGSGALGYLIEKHGWNKLRLLYSDDDEIGFYVTKEDVEKMWSFERVEMDYDLKLEVIVQVIYEETRGNSCIDEILDQSVGDISIGVSGVPDTLYSADTADLPTAYESCWVRYKGASIHFRFVSFTSYDRLKKVCKQSVGYKMKNQFSEKEGFKLGYGKDGSRRSAAIEPFGESPALWVRKFTAKQESNETLFGGIGGFEKVINVEKALVRGGVTIPVCGNQGAGKTTKLEAFVKYVQPFYALRVLESEFEARLRWKYPDKNIYSMEANESTVISPSEAYNFTLRTAGDIYIIGEARSDDMIVNVTRTANRGGRAVYFTFHPNTPQATIPEIANALIREKMYVNLKDAVATALETVKVCVFVRVDLELNCRYYEIYEFVPRLNEIPNTFMNPDLSFEESQRLFMKTMYSYMKHMTSADVYYDTVPIVTFNRKTKCYQFQKTISDRLYNTLMDNSPLEAERDALCSLFRPNERFNDYLLKNDLEKSILTAGDLAQIADELNLNTELFQYDALSNRKGA